MLEARKRGSSGESRQRYQEETQADRAETSRTQAHSYPPDSTGATGADAGATGEREQ